jgi:hypothetical protein
LRLTDLRAHDCNEAGSGAGCPESDRRDRIGAKEDRAVLNRLEGQFSPAGASAPSRQAPEQQSSHRSPVGDTGERPCGRGSTVGSARTRADDQCRCHERGVHA